MYIIKNKHPPKLKVPEFTCDNNLFKIEQSPLHLLNKYHSIAFLGKPGSGKTSMIVSLLTNKKYFKKK